MPGGLPGAGCARRPDLAVAARPVQRAAWAVRSVAGKFPSAWPSRVMAGTRSAARWDRRGERRERGRQVDARGADGRRLDVGEIRLPSRRVSFGPPRDAVHAGIGFMSHEPTYFPDLTVTDEHTGRSLADQGGSSPTQAGADSLGGGAAVRDPGRSGTQDERSQYRRTPAGRDPQGAPARSSLAERGHAVYSPT